jgi:YebC/PmpR family DNA-binding regulatory protein
MSGHNKWSTIKHKKGAADAKRSKIFSRIAKEIQIAVKEGGPDEANNARLRLAIQNGKGANMPKDNIQRAISSATKDGSSLQEVTFEGYAPNAIALFIECLTDNNNRTVSAVRSMLTKKGGSLGTNGSLSFVFSRKGVITVPKGTINPDDFELEMIDAGVEEIETNDENFELYCSVEDFASVRKKLEEMGIEAENAELRRIPNELKTLPINDALRVLRIIEALEEDDDVQNVYHNLELTEEIMEAWDAD